MTRWSGHFPCSIWLYFNRHFLFLEFGFSLIIKSRHIRIRRRCQSDSKTRRRAQQKNKKRRDNGRQPVAVCNLSSVSWNLVPFFLLFFSLKSRIVPSQSNPVAQRVGTHHHLHTTTTRTRTRRKK